MKIVHVLNIAFTIICMMLFPTFVGYKLGNVVVGILIGGLATISYVLYVAIKQK